MRDEKNCSLCNKKYKALISKYVPYVLKYMPCIFDKNKCLKHRNLQKVEKSLNICRCIRFLCIWYIQKRMWRVRKKKPIIITFICITG